MYAPSLLNVILRKHGPTKKQLFVSKDLRSDIIRISGLTQIQLKTKIQSLLPSSGIVMKPGQALLLYK